MTVIMAGDLTTEQQEAGLSAIRQHTGDTSPFWRKASLAHLLLADRIIRRQLVTHAALPDAARSVADTIAPRRPIRSIVINRHHLNSLAIVPERTSALVRELHSRESGLTYFVINYDGSITAMPASEVLELLVGQPA